MASARSKRKGRNASRRYTSNVFSMFTENQINEFKEAFSMIDANKDGIIDQEDLEKMYLSLGKTPEQSFYDEMLPANIGPINFTMFLTMFGDKMMGCDPEESIQHAFSCFDPDDTGVINEDRLRELLTTMGDRWTNEKVDELFSGAPIDERGFDYKEFTKLIMHGEKEAE